jgi:hypothetical protein
MGMVMMILNSFLKDMADALDGYAPAAQYDLWNNPKFVNMFSGMGRLVVCGRLMPQAGEAGFVQSTHNNTSVTNLTTAFANSGNRELAQLLYAANGNRWEDAHKIALGYLAGDIWAFIATVIMARTPVNPDVTLFVVLAVLGFLAVVISQKLPKLFYMPSWLAGWAIGMLAMNLDKTTPPMSLVVQIGAAMLVGVYYIGALVDRLHRLMNR